MHALGAVAKILVCIDSTRRILASITKGLLVALAALSRDTCTLVPSTLLQGQLFQRLPALTATAVRKAATDNAGARAAYLSTRDAAHRCAARQ
jgi:hypothetical protein